eukprot:TRINITY_DN14058_c0_g1_i1.p1 TRINITY_DN14058_c0_g1~~TRINITY_DN14058_c0_g1_i1.p1  ORF type:complete len:232 (-),score=67.42 TRINITY_DN14058_c0_g1_i1:146-841(-)
MFSQGSDRSNGIVNKQPAPVGQPTNNNSNEDKLSKFVFVDLAILNASRAAQAAPLPPLNHIIQYGAPRGPLEEPNHDDVEAAGDDPAEDAILISDDDEDNDSDVPKKKSPNRSGVCRNPRVLNRPPVPPPAPAPIPPVLAPLPPPPQEWIDSSRAAAPGPKKAAPNRAPAPTEQPAAAKYLDMPPHVLQQATAEGEAVRSIEDDDERMKQTLALLHKYKEYLDSRHRQGHS